MLGSRLIVPICIPGLVDIVGLSPDTLGPAGRTNMMLKREGVEPSAVRPPGWPEGVGTQPNDVDETGGVYRHDQP